MSFLPGQVLACSKSEYEALSQIVPKGHLSRLDNAIDTDVLQQHSALRSHSPKKVTLCTLGGIRYQKAPWLFAQIATAIGNQLDDIEVSWLWVGDENEEDRTYAKELEKAGVNISGWLSRTDALKAIAQCDIYIQTSLWEGLPLSVLEAQGLGLSVIVSSCEGNQNAMLDNETGLIANDVEEFIQSAKELILEPEKRVAFGEQAQQWIIANYSIQQLHSKLETIYKKGTSHTKPKYSTQQLPNK